MSLVCTSVGLVDPAALCQSDEDPLELLVVYAEQQRMRLIDVFMMLDKDGGGSLSRDELIAGFAVSSRGSS